MLESERKLEAIKISMIDVQSDKNESERPYRFGCESCHNWKKEINALQVRLDKTLQLKVCFHAKSIRFSKRIRMVKAHLIVIYLVIIVAKRIIPLKSAILGRC